MAAPASSSLAEHEALNDIPAGVRHSRIACRTMQCSSGRGAPDVAAALDQEGAQAFDGGRERGGHAPRSGAEDDEVVLLVPSLRRRRHPGRLSVRMTFSRTGVGAR
jgi:hypothetical protein